MAIIDLSLLAAPEIVEAISYESILQDRKNSLLALLPEEIRASVEKTLNLETEPINILLQENAYREIVLRNRINNAARSVMISFATGTDLNQIGANYGVLRLVVTPEDNTAIPPVSAIYEADSDYRNRIILSLESYTTAGSRGSYIYHGLSSDSDVKDISAVSPTPGVVDIYVLTKSGNGTASPSLISTVNAALNDEDVRPLTDQVNVYPAAILPFSINAQIFVKSGPDREIVQDSVVAAMQQLVADNRRIGGRVSVSSIYSVLQQPGVEYATLSSPAADVIADATQAPYCTGFSIEMESAA